LEYFSAGFYVCSLSRIVGRSLAASPTAFARPLPGKQSLGPANR